MRHHHGILAAFAVTWLITSCKKEDVDVQQAPPDPNAAYSIADFALLDPGNYWVYERMRYDSNGVEIGGPFLDSFFVAGDTLIGGNMFQVVRYSVVGATNSNPWRMLRDSADRIITNYHSVHFRYGVFDQVAWTDTVPNSIYIDHTVGSIPEDLVLPAGPITAYKVSTGIGILGNLPEVPPERLPYYYWAPGIGKVKQMEPFLASGIMDVSELLRYHVQ